MTQRTLLTAAEFKAALHVTPAKGGVLKMGGAMLPWQPVTMGQYAQHVAHDPSVQAFYTFGGEVALAKETAALPEGGHEPDAERFQDASARSAFLASCAFLACAFGQPGSVEARDLIAACPEEDITAALDVIEYASWGDDPERFFGGVARLMQSRPLKALARTAMAKADGSSDPTQTTSTPTGSRATTPRARTTRKPAAKKRRGR